MSMLRQRVLPLAAVALVVILTPWAVEAAAKALKISGGIQTTPQSSNPLEAGKTGFYTDASSRPIAHDGTTANKIAACNATTKGDLCTYTGSAWTKRAVGSNGQCLKANSATSDGVEWGACGGGGGGDLQSAYDAGGFIQLGANGEIVIDDNSPSVGRFMRFRDFGGGTDVYDFGVNQFVARGVEIDPVGGGVLGVGQVLAWNGSKFTPTTISGGYSTIRNGASSLTARSQLQCDGTLVVCSDDAGNSETDITLGSAVARRDQTNTFSSGVDINLVENGIGTSTSSTALKIENTTPQSVSGDGNRQFSPMITACGQGWDATAGSSKTACISTQVQPNPQDGNEPYGEYWLYTKKQSGSNERIARITRISTAPGASGLRIYGDTDGYYLNLSSWAGNALVGLGHTIGVNSAVSGINLSPSGGTSLYVDASGTYPSADNAMPLGKTGAGFKEVRARHLVGNGNTPTCTVGAALGTGSPSCSVAGTDGAYEVTVTTGSSGAGTGTMVTVTSSGAWGATAHCVMTPTTSGSGTALYAVYYDRAGSSPTTQVWGTANALATGSTYKFEVLCIQ
jgi:hypothetical protein